VSAHHCLVCSLPLERKGNVWACTATASHDYHRPLTLAEKMADLCAELVAARDHSADVSQRLAVAEVARDAYRQQRDEARANHRHEMTLRAACLVEIDRMSTIVDAAIALLDNLETLDEPHPLDFAVRGIDVERLREALADDEERDSVNGQLVRARMGSGE
jgi:hypothetical protein